MEYARLGRSSLKVSRLCIGCMSFGGVKSGNYGWTIDYRRSEKIIGRAIDLGINFFDTADVYSGGKSEEILGRAVEGRREDLVIATKVFNPTGDGPNDRGLGRKHVRRGIQRSLERLRTKHIDLYQVHRWDYEAPVEETLCTLNDLVRSGVVDFIGASSMWAWQFAEALRVSERMGLERFVSMQNHYNLTYREEEREMIPLCLSKGVGLIPWSPLARGFLTGKYRRDRKPKGRRYSKDVFLRERYFSPADYDIVERLEEVAEEKGIAPAQMALAWLLHKPGVVSPVAGFTKPEQLEELVEAVDIKVSEDEIRRLEEPYRPRKVEGHS